MGSPGREPGNKGEEVAGRTEDPIVVGMPTCAPITVDYDWAGWCRALGGKLEATEVAWRLLERSFGLVVPEATVGAW